MKGKEKKRLWLWLWLRLCTTLSLLCFFFFLYVCRFFLISFPILEKQNGIIIKLENAFPTLVLSHSVWKLSYIKNCPSSFFFLSSFLLFYFYYLFLFLFFPFHHFIYHQSINSFHLQLSSNYTMHRTYSLRQNRAPTAAQLQSPAPPPSSTKSGRFFGKGSIGMWKTRHTISIVKINHL